MLAENGAVIFACQTAVFRDIAERGELPERRKKRVQRFTADDPPHGDLAVHRGIDGAAAIVRREPVILPRLVQTGDVRTADLVHAADALISIDHMIPDCEHSRFSLLIVLRISIIAESGGEM